MVVENGLFGYLMSLLSLLAYLLHCVWANAGSNVLNSGNLNAFL